MTALEICNLKIQNEHLGGLVLGTSLEQTPRLLFLLKPNQLSYTLRKSQTVRVAPTASSWPARAQLCPTFWHRIWIWTSRDRVSAYYLTFQISTMKDLRNETLGKLHPPIPLSHFLQWGSDLGGQCTQNTQERCFCTWGEPEPSCARPLV